METTSQQFKQFDFQNEVNIPTELKKEGVKNWVVYRIEPNGDGKLTKVAYIPEFPTRKASSVAPTQWTTFNTAIKALRLNERLNQVVEDDPTDPFSWLNEVYPLQGIGFEIEGTIYSVIDLDHCVKDGKVTEWALKIVNLMKSYTEITVSQKGLRIWVVGKIIKKYLPDGQQGRRKNGIEIYSGARFVTVSGQRIPGYKSIQSRQGELNQLCEEFFGQSGEALPVEAQEMGTSTLNDNQFFDRILNSRQKEKFYLLFHKGDTTGYPSQSEADQALCNLISFWVNRDPSAIDRIFRRSALMRSKWESASYRNRTIQRAIRDTRNSFGGVLIKGDENIETVWADGWEPKMGGCKNG